MKVRRQWTVRETLWGQTDRVTRVNCRMCSQSQVSTPVMNVRVRCVSTNPSKAEDTEFFVISCHFESFYVSEQSSSGFRVFGFWGSTRPPRAMFFFNLHGPEIEIRNAWSKNHKTPTLNRNDNSIKIFITILRTYKSWKKLVFNSTKKKHKYIELAIRRLRNFSNGRTFIHISSEIIENALTRIIDRQRYSSNVSR